MFQGEQANILAQWISTLYRIFCKISKNSAFSTWRLCNLQLTWKPVIVGQNWQSCNMCEHNVCTEFHGNAWKQLVVFNCIAMSFNVVSLIAFYYYIMLFLNRVLEIVSFLHRIHLNNHLFTKYFWFTLYL